MRGTFFCLWWIVASHRWSSSCGWCSGFGCTCWVEGLHQIPDSTLWVTLKPFCTYLRYILDCLSDRLSNYRVEYINIMRRFSKKPGVFTPSCPGSGTITVTSSSLPLWDLESTPLCAFPFEVLSMLWLWIRLIVLEASLRIPEVQRGPQILYQLSKSCVFTESYSLNCTYSDERGCGGVVHLPLDHALSVARC